MSVRRAIMPMRVRRGDQIGMITVGTLEGRLRPKPTKGYGPVGMTIGLMPTRRTRVVGIGEPRSYSSIVATRDTCEPGWLRPITPRSGLGAMAVGLIPIQVCPISERLHCVHEKEALFCLHSCRCDADDSFVSLRKTIRKNKRVRFQSAANSVL